MHLVSFPSYGLNFALLSAVLNLMVHFQPFIYFLSTANFRPLAVANETYRFMSQVLKHTEAFEGARLTTIDGLRVDYPSAWGLIRASNTTPCLVLRFEADSHEALSEIQGRFKLLILKLAPGLKLPF